MEIIIFAGPTLSVAEASQVLTATYLPPAAQGDLYRIARCRPRVIGLIDGFFDRVPAVWHKEILWAMERGIHVYGSASMGALRAAELADFGMIGVGQVFERFHAGTLEDDDEVAVLHGPPNAGYAAASDAMVNIRATMQAAVDQEVLTDALADQLIACAKSLFYQERSYARILKEVRSESPDEPTWSAFEQWLPSAKVDQKKLDALQMLREIAVLDENTPPKQVVYRVEPTTFWQKAMEMADQVADEDDAPPPQMAQGEALEEFRLTGLRFREACRLAVLSKLIADQADVFPADQLNEAVDLFFLERDMATPEERVEWLKRNQLTEHGLHQLVAREWTLDRLIDEHFDALPQYLLDHLRLGGDFEPLSQRARAKRQWLANAPPLPSPPSRGQLLRWYLGKHGIAPEEFADLPERLGYEHRDDFFKAVLDDWRYENREQSTG